MNLQTQEILVTRAELNPRVSGSTPNNTLCPRGAAPPPLLSCLKIIQLPFLHDG